MHEEHSILRLEEGVAKGHSAIVLDTQEAKRVLARVKSLEQALAGLIRSQYERQSPAENQAS